MLIQDRPVLGGNASSEVRLWILGATSHMGNNNRWAREGGIVDEILVENMYRNPEGNPLILDTILLEKVVDEPNITLLLNTAVFELTKHDADTIRSVRAFCSQNSTMYDVQAALFCDASGDGVVGFLAGAAFRLGAESPDEFGEGVARDQGYGELLGHSIYFYTKDVGRPVKFVPPSYALDDITRIPRWRNFNAREHGCQLWWIEHGGRLDTVHDTERIKWELWEVVYGVWDHIKNSGEFPEAETLTLEWVGQIPGKRESRRFEGDYMLRQQDIIVPQRHDDAISFGGWAVDLHPADGIFSEKSACTQWHSKGVYQIPYRCLYSRNINNLFLGGRIISVSHVAFGSTRVMATCGHNGQAVGMAAALCRKLDVRPRDLLQHGRIGQLQRRLQRVGHFIPHVDLPDLDDLAPSATITASSELQLAELPPNGEFVLLDDARAMLIPVQAGPMPTISFWVEADEPTTLAVQLRTCSREAGFTPDEILSEVTVELLAAMGEPAEAEALGHAVGGAVATKTRGTAVRNWQQVDVNFDTFFESPRYVMICLLANEAVSLALSDVRLTGILSLAHRMDRKVAKSAVQTPPADIGIDSFEFWLPERRPGGKNLAMNVRPAITGFGPNQLTTGPARPTNAANAWIAALDDSTAYVCLRWDVSQTMGRVEVSLDTDFDHPMESVLMGHPESVVPLCVPSMRFFDAAGKLLAEVVDNHQTRVVVPLPATETNELRIEFDRRQHNIPVSAFRIRVFEENRS